MDSFNNGHIDHDYRTIFGGRSYKCKKKIIIIIQTVSKINLIK